MTLFALLLLAAAPASAPTAAPELAEPKPADMTPSEIRAFNKLVDRNHPYFIKCVKQSDTGSLVGRRPACRTNERWSLLEKAARASSDQLASDMTSRSHASGN